MHSMDFAAGGDGGCLARHPGREVGRRLGSWFLDLQILRDPSRSYKNYEFRLVLTDSPLTEPSWEVTQLFDIILGLRHHWGSYTERRKRACHLQHLDFLQELETSLITMHVERDRMSPPKTLFLFCSFCSSWIRLLFSLWKQLLPIILNYLNRHRKVCASDKKMCVWI